MILMTAIYWKIIPSKVESSFDACYFHVEPRTAIDLCVMRVLVYSWSVLRKTVLNRALIFSLSAREQLKTLQQVKSERIVNKVC